jgi:small subunit ribosomal protein S1
MKYISFSIGVHNRMEQNDAEIVKKVTPEQDQSFDNNSNNMEALLQQEELGLSFPTQGEIRTGVIASINPSQILVSVGTKSEGVITGKELEQIPPSDLASFVVGQEIQVFVVNPEDQNGNLVLSYTRAQDEANWLEAEELLKSGNTLHTSIIGFNKGGLIVPLGGLRGFVPASQISLSRRVSMSGETPEQRWGKMVGESIDVCVIEVDRERRRLIVSERAASTETREMIKERVLEELKEGEVRTGRVTSLADFGAFVNINGADGLVHLSEISWDRIRHPGDVLSVGQEVKVKVIAIDREKKRIGLSIRQLQDDPWGAQAEHFQVGQLVEGKITRLTKFGAFAQLEGDLEGLIHISEISDKRIEHPKEVLHEGDVVTLRVIKIDAQNHRIGLSLRRVDSPAYADMDWQTIADELDLSENEEGDSSASQNSDESTP